MRSGIKRKSASNLFIIFIALAFALLVLWQVATWLVNTYVYWANYQTIEVHVIRRGKARLDTEYNQLLADDYRIDAFYVLTEELGLLRTDIYGFDHIGLGKETFDITKKELGGEWWIIKDYSIPKPMIIEGD